MYYHAGVVMMGLGNLEGKAMKWQGRRQSRNVQDRRRSGGGAVIGGGSIGVLAIVVVGYFLGIDLTPLLQDQGGTSSQPRDLSAQEEAAGDFAAVTLADTEEVWAQIFQDQLGTAYQPATMVLFSRASQSACGGASAATGPFYCPTDQSIYLDTDFFNVLAQQLGATGDFAAAYVIAHEVGHHVQDLLGVLDQTNAARAQMGQADANAVSVMVELQADCFAGIWAAHAETSLGTIEVGDVAEAMNAAARIGDDVLQGAAGQAVRPDSFTHGSAAARQQWFTTGYEAGTLESCNTFAN
ncbi:predicted metalloprotease transmembrane protein [Ketogulonicigenium vulgare WSH-001]|uniref:Predicted metalloprotease transmembrane protein n=3 Tax=Ketogulonicigenium vulgare TaxID=92945 RepID=F9Y6B8_KETVW|nr:predicted metalloprotease transmembrane protein [Ketogulonicigenium vulgare WSH-001]